MKTDWKFSGDVNLEYGGTYFDLSEWDNGYIDAVRVTDLDSACGFDGAVMIEKIVILVDEKYFAESLECCGWTTDDLDLETESGRLMMADALLSYGHFDPANDYYEPENEVIQTLDDGPMSFNGWKASKTVLSENLAGYVRSNYLS